MRWMPEIGVRSGRLVVVASDAAMSIHNAPASLVRCDCGTEKMMTNSDIKRGRTKSCGCWARERAGNLNIKHGQARIDGAAGTPTYRSWRSMIQRCYYPDSNGYENYGGRGIVVCNRWRDSFDAFLADVGHRPSSEHSLDRIDSDGNYEPGNCRWATLAEQANNKRNTVYLTANGVTRTISGWMKITGLTRRILEFRIRNGWSPERIVETPSLNNAAKTHCKRGHELTGDNVRPINGGRGRRCVECCRLRDMQRVR